MGAAETRLPWSALCSGRCARSLGYRGALVQHGDRGADVVYNTLHRVQGRRRKKRGCTVEAFILLLARWRRIWRRSVAQRVVHLVCISNVAGLGPGVGAEERSPGGAGERQGARRVTAPATIGEEDARDLALADDGCGDMLARAVRQAIYVPGS